MNVASKELCHELYKLSDWDSNDLLHYLDDALHYKNLFQSDAEDENTYCPAYDLGYLLRKLPINQKRRNGTTSTAIIGIQLIRRGTAYDKADYWEASYWKSHVYVWADTPENAAAKLCIELIKQGIITPNQRERE